MFWPLQVVVGFYIKNRISNAHDRKRSFPERNAAMEGVLVKNQKLPGSKLHST